MTSIRKATSWTLQQIGVGLMLPLTYLPGAEILWRWRW